MKAILAEKPSVAREIAAILGAREKHEGYISGNGYHITWAFGHLVGLALPDDYGVTGYSETSLPILPDPFLLTPRKSKKEKAYVTDTGALAQLNIISKIISECESIIVATDAGREGELIFRYIYQYLRCAKPFERLWISSLTEKAILKGMESLKPGSDFEGLYQSAMARSRADWLVGINASQALSIRAMGNYSLGRVQTPVLAMVCRRYLEHTDFQVKDYWQIALEHRREYTDFRSVSSLRWDNRKEALSSLRMIERNGTAIVKKVEIKSVLEQPPLLFDLTALQQQANTLLGFSASETLEIAQSLYEKRFITYPRTASRYITEDLWPELPTLIRGLQQRPCCKDVVAKVRWGRFNRHIVNDLKVTDHHGLLITDKVPSALTAKENAIYDMIAIRILEAIAEPCHKQCMAAILESLHYEFTLQGTKITEPGWRDIKGLFSDTDKTLDELPLLKEGDELKIKNSALLEKKTQPPVLFTEAGILQVMESSGLGTPSTRAAIIETLLLRNYLEREKKKLIPTQKGLQVYQWVKAMKIADPVMTAEWEHKLLEIEATAANPEIFKKEIEIYTKSITQELLRLPAAEESHPLLCCPKCKKNNLVIDYKAIRCPDKGCKWLQYRMVCKAMLPIQELERLITQGKTSLITGMKSASGKSFDAYLVLDTNGCVTFSFENKKKKPS